MSDPQNDNMEKNVKTKQSIVKRTPLPFELTASNFLNKLGSFTGQKVIVEVEGQSFEICKDLLCGCSPYFKAAFDGKFKEGVEQKCTLEETTAEIFAALVRWLYQGFLSFPRVAFDKESAAYHKIQNDWRSLAIDAQMARTKIDNDAEQIFQTEHELLRHIEFLDLLNYLQIEGPTTSIAKKMKDIFRQNPDHLTKAHIIRALESHETYPLLSVVANAVATKYIHYMFFSTCGNPFSRKEPFQFQEDMNANPDFELLVLRAVTKAINDKLYVAEDENREVFYVVAPPAGQDRYKVTLRRALQETCWL